MLNAIVILYSLYTLLRLYISIMQIGYLNDVRKKSPVLMAKEAYTEAGAYAASKEKLKLIGYFVDYLLFLWWVFGGFAALLHFVGTDGTVWHSVLFVLGFVAINYIVSLPMEWYEKFVLDKRFGFSTMTPKLFVTDQLKSALLFAIIGSAVIAALVAVMHSFETWWFWAFVLLFAVVIAANLLMPTLMALFNKFTPLQEGVLKARIEQIMQEAGLKSDGIFVMDAGKRDNRLNAFFGGLGKSKRVVLFDTLLEKLDDDEIVAVLGHELGHFKHGDIFKNIALVGLLLFVALYLFGHLSDTLFVQMGVQPDAGAKIAMMILLFGPLSLFFTPLLSFLSRHNEFAADRHGSEVGGKQHLISALLKLVRENKAFPLSHPLVIFFYYTHPPILERLKALGYDPSQSDADASHPSIVDMAQGH